jgi:hypothetical protein
MTTAVASGELTLPAHDETASPALLEDLFHREVDIEFEHDRPTIMASASAREFRRGAPLR